MEESPPKSCALNADHTEPRPIKRKHFSVAQKIEIIKEIEKGTKKSELCRRFHLHSSTVHTIWKNRAKIIDAFDNSITKVKRFRKPLYNEIDVAVFQWYREQRKQNLPVTGVLIKIKAQECATRLGIKDFVCSNGWIDRFKTRHEICFRKGSHADKHDEEEEEEEGDDGEEEKDWMNVMWPLLRQGYEEKDIFAMDQTGLFYRLLPHNMSAFENEQCIRGEMVQERVTVLFAVNMDGSQKRRLTVIGKAACKVKKHANVEYVCNERAWMSSDAFETDMRKWDAELKGQQQNIILLLHDCLLYPCVTDLERIKFVYLPMDEPGVLQPLQQGVIADFKCHYRKLMLYRFVKGRRKGKPIDVTLLEALKDMERAWEKLTELSIRTCFVCAGFKNANPDPSPLDAMVRDEKLQHKYSDTSFGKLRKSVAGVGVRNFDVDRYISCDDDLVTNMLQSDQYVVGNVKEEPSEEYFSEHETNVDFGQSPTLEQALDAAQVLQRFCETFGDHDILDQVNNIKTKLEQLY